MSELIGKEYLIIKQIDSGATADIFLVRSINSEEIFAAKVYKHKSGYFYKEIEILKRLNNTPGIINLIAYGEEQITINGISGEDDIQQYIILDYMPNKDLLYYVKNSNGIDENKAKHLFYKILKSVEQCHIKGICHRDLKLENILLDNANNPILCDFGFSSFIERENSSEFLGTSYYAPPEILRQIPYNGFKCDIFSLGVVLFCMIFGNFAFSAATITNRLYKLIIRNKYKEYWEEIGKMNGKEKVENVSEECKRLILKMLAYNPNDRPSIDDILNDEWMKI